MRIFMGAKTHEKGMNRRKLYNTFYTLNPGLFAKIWDKVFKNG